MYPVYNSNTLILLDAFIIKFKAHKQYVLSRKQSIFFDKRYFAIEQVINRLKKIQENTNQSS
jgi:hypothetical protein